ncbi:NAD(P)-dependent alcohol dehydrogenase [Alicyclobacillus fastidiosus]|uniref:NAD(P)-dependent alcohol dehydrogenase n=1 Tax=Alicyclobacillus fastidiosus TaxID=392011 RepID=A0ABV5ABH7_9BACL|nr:NAD(P)-dependent alcohol dehydrogenase [Alicyclobacillus fastidiosus]WEH11983.1 NAD(P)-dependent alcohol dehydrogenase [Alicyclobacillus fastidiosus]
MQAAVLTKPMEIVMKTLPVPRPKFHEVLVKVMAVGVCGSDVHYYEHGRIGRYVVESPIILGHECAGVVAAVGDAVSRFQPGDRVAIEPGVACGKCTACKQGRYNLCPDVQFLATPPVDGAFVQYISIRQDNVFAIPPQLSFEEAALVEPFSVGLQAAFRSGIQAGDTIAIMGMGPVGLMAVVAAKAYGAKTIIVTDLEPVRLNAAMRLGASYALNVSNQDAVQAIHRLTDGIGVDVAWETAGNPRALQAALASVRRGGRMAIVGLPAQDDIALNVPRLVDNEVDMYGVFRYANTYPRGIEFLSSGIADVRSLITDRYSLSQAQEAMERARTNKSGSLKVMVYPNGEPV